ncbi:DUF4129 domain-containing protein [Blastopirellula marina]|uniref:Protein-glutamine gamma-glutamyltransferase-like C-terminal domain-containing protein n=1 Tax=Blastopirellula marina TaxID=124 RepID=A0A2S8GKE7_9BACT|nr:DUF4129 domain-containing protein [Blastopirellula marina]PQO44908.1 hypothetical protein C5Y93_17615 [Blastopirellula marina]
MMRTLLMTTFLFLATSLPLSAQEEQWGDPVGERAIYEPLVEGREALSRVPSANWYDGDSDQLQTIPIPGEPTPPGTRPGAPPKPKTKTTPAATPTGTGGGWLTSLFNLPIASLIFYTFVVALLGVIGYLIYRAYQAGGSTAKVGKGASPETFDEKTRQIDKVEHLPFDVKKKDANLLEEARRCYEAGNFNEAIVYLFSFQLLELDKGHIIRLAKGKTNGQYLREAGRDRGLRQILQSTMNAFEDVFFGNRDLSQDRFERCWSQIPQFDQLLAGGKS